MRIYRQISEPIRESLSWEERWKAEDRGIVTAWEVGRRENKDNPELAIKASKGELVELPWKGGYLKELKVKKKFGTLLYLAAWQGLRGEDLDIDTEVEKIMICPKTKMIVTFTSDQNKYAKP